MSAITLIQSLHIFLQVDRSPATNHQYAIILRHLAAAIGPDRDITLIRYEDLLDYLDRRRAALKPLTLRGYTSIIKAFFNWCVQRGYITQSPAADIAYRPLRRDPHRSRAVPPAELAAMVEYARLTSPRNYAIMLFFADTGCRVGGLVSLTLPNLHLEEGSAWIKEKGDKWHLARFGDETAAALARWLTRRPAVDHDYIWTGLAPRYKPLSEDGVAALVRRLAERTGASRLWSPHAIRHSVGHAYAKAGIPITVTQHKLGHSHPSITAMNYYPDDDVYLDEVSRQMALAALRTPEENRSRQQPKQQSEG